MKKFSVLLMLWLLIVTIPFSASTDNGRLFSGEYIIDTSSTRSDLSVLTSQEEWPYTAGVDYVDGEVLVITDYYVDMSEFTGNAPYIFNGIPIDSIEPLFNATTEEEIAARIERMGNIFSYHIILDDSVSVQNAVYTLSLNKDIVVAEPNFIHETSEDYTDSIEETVSALSTVSQWAHDYLEMDDVWGYGFTGSDDVTVAVFDGGFVQHPDLQNNIDWENGFDATGGTDSVHPEDQSTHGTKCASIIGADYDDDYINGICQDIRILPVKVSTSAPGINTVAVLSSAETAIELGADIFSMSFAMSDNNCESLRAVVAGANVLCVVSAGNEHKNMVDASLTSSKRHDDSRWIVVGAIDENESIAVGTTWGSNYSMQYCDIFAPGKNVAALECTLSEDNVASDFRTTNSNGTSIATPHVAAACALIWSHATHLTASQVKDLIMANVKRVDGLKGYCVSGGTLSIKNAIEAIYAECRGAYTKGDVNGDGLITIEDKDLCYSIYNGSITPTEQQRAAADVNNDGDQNLFDSMAIQSYVNRIHYFPPY